MNFALAAVFGENEELQVAREFAKPSAVRCQQQAEIIVFDLKGLGE